MDTCEVKLTVGRAGPAGAQNAGAVIEVGLAEAGRMLVAGQIERPDAKVIKAIAAAAAKVETAADDPADVETAEAQADGETGAEG